MTKSKIKVLYDHQIFTVQKYGGISKYFSELFRYLDVPYRKGYLISLNEYSPRFKVLTHLMVKGKRKILNVINRRYTRFLLKHSRYTHYHPTYYDVEGLKHNKGKLVVTVHDMIHELYPQYFDVSDQTKTQKAIMVQKADAIIAISKNTKRDLLKRYDLDESRIHVIYHATSLEKVTVTKEALNLPERYLLFVGSRRHYKNFTVVFEAFNDLVKEDANLHLVCVGGGAFTEEEQALFNAHQCVNRLSQHNVDETALAAYYQQALAFIFPSLYEGFGIPILEAFTLDCPVLLSDTEVFKEVAEDACLYFDGQDSDSLKAQLTSLIQQPKLRESLIQKGQTRVKAFTWEKAVSQLENVYESL